jgi:hypothetical protein
MLAIRNLVPRASSYSKSLDKKEHRVGRSWILVGENNSFIKYTFARNGELFQTAPSCRAVKGSWTLLSDTNQIDMELPGESLVLRPLFADQFVLLVCSLESPLYQIMTN